MQYNPKVITELGRSVMMLSRVRTELWSTVMWGLAFQWCGFVSEGDASQASESLPALSSRRKRRVPVRCAQQLQEQQQQQQQHKQQQEQDLHEEVNEK